MDHEYQYFGMHLFWWFVWCILLIWIFIIPRNIPGQRLKKERPLDVLKYRFAISEISNEEYLEKKKILEKD